MESSRTLENYKIYKWTRKEVVSNLLIWLLISILYGYLFYKSWIAIAIIIFGFPIYLKEQKKQKILNRKSQLRDQFKEVIVAVSSSLRAGYSIENAFVESYSDIKMLFGEDSMMSRELMLLQKGMENNITLERQLAFLADRSGIEEITEFSEVFQIAKRNGGDMNGIILRCSNIICEKTEVIKEIEVVVHAKQFEQKIMNLVPIFVIIYIQISSPGFFEALYNNFAGIMIMTGCLFLYLVAFMLGKKITTFEI